MAPSDPELRAQYTNTSALTPSVTFALAIPLPPVSPPSSGPPTEYLRALRAAITTTQAQVNEALTSRMEEDKLREAEAAAAAAAAAGTNTEPGAKGGKSNKRKKGKAEIDEEAEELNYGEDIVEED